MGHRLLSWGLVVCSAAVMFGCSGAVGGGQEADGVDSGASGSPEAAQRTPERIEFASEDGTQLVALYYPPEVGPAPGILLMHQMGASKADWQPLVDRLRAQRPGLALLAVDFPGHGESDGTISDEAALAAARAAVQELRDRAEVDDAQVILVGASIGADAAVDACGEGCVGAVSVSPGGFLGVPYDEALAALRGRDVPVLCLAAEGDGSAARTCASGQAVGLSDYEVHIYDGGLHGNPLVADSSAVPGPAPVERIVGWLDAHWPR